MRTIKGQTISTTELDLRGERITREQLTSIFDKMPSEQLLNQDHDLSQPIIARTYNKRLVETENGELAIKVDVDVLNEEEFARRGGFSISFIRNHYTVNNLRVGEVTILFNPRLIELKEIKPLIAISNDSVQIDAKEVIQKGIDPITIVVIVFITQAVAGEFFKRAGSDAYDLLKVKLKELAARHRENRKEELKFHFQFTAEIAGKSVEVFIESDTDNLSVIAEQSLALQSFLDQLVPQVEHEPIVRVTLQITKEDPYLQIAHIVNDKGADMKLMVKDSES
jgi:hypothetical protein